MIRTVIALIPARGGSEGIPRKNLAEVGGISLLARAIKCAQGCPQISSVVVSSDDKEIQESAQKMGATVLDRPRDLSSGTARAEEVVEHFLSTPEGLSLRLPDRMVYLQPTSPFRTSSHVAAAIESMDSEGAGSLVSVKKVSEHPAKTLTIGESGVTGPSIYGADPSANRQELPIIHYPNGAIYAFTLECFRLEGKIPTIGSLPFLMGALESFDIDTPNDLMIARAVAEYAHI